MIGQEILYAAERQKADAKKVSFGPGCGVCCRQLVPISETEASYLQHKVIPNLDSNHRATVMERIQTAKEKLQDQGLWDSLEALPTEKDAAKRQSLGIRYFLNNIACPFLENESYSIHPQRPMACREYLVTSPAEQCSKPTADSVDPVRFPVRFPVHPSHALIRLDAESSGGPVWKTLITALATTPPEHPKTTASPVDFIKNFLSKLG